MGKHLNITLSPFLRKLDNLPSAAVDLAPPSPLQLDTEEYLQQTIIKSIMQIISKISLDMMNCGAILTLLVSFVRGCSIFIWWSGDNQCTIVNFGWRFRYESECDLQKGVSKRYSLQDIRWKSFNCRSARFCKSSYNFDCCTLPI